MTEQFLRAVEMGNVIEVEAALAAGVDVNTATTLCVLTRAQAAKAKSSGAQIFIDESRYAVSEDFGWAPIYFAKTNGREEIQKMLKTAGLDDEVDVETTVDDGCTALLISACNGHTEVARVLVQAGADVCAATVKGGRFALFYASMNGNLPMVRYLLTNGANVNQQCID